MSYNRIANCHNRFQGEYKKVLCVCSAGLLRSPTTAVVLSQEPYNFNTRAAGLTEEYALIPVDEVLLEWADEIVCMTQNQKIDLDARTDKPVICLDIPDNFEYRNPALIEMIKKNYDEFSVPGGTDPVTPKKKVVRSKPLKVKKAKKK